MKSNNFLLIFLLALAINLPPALAQNQPESVKANSNVVGIITGGVNGTYVRIGSDLSTVLDAKGAIRVITKLGKGSVQNVYDLMYLKGVDMSIVQSDVLQHLRKTDPSNSAIKKLAYIAKIYDEEIHILTRNFSGIFNTSDLNGKRIAIGNKGSGSSMTAGLVFSALNISFDAVHLNSADAIEALKEGTIDAAFMVVGKPSSLIRNITQKDGLRFIPAKINDTLAETYTPAIITPKDYPNFVTKDINTIAVGAILAAYGSFPINHPRMKNLEIFCRQLVELQDEFSKVPRHPKWSQFAPRSTVPGWKRFFPMAKILLEKGL